MSALLAGSAIPLGLVGSPQAEAAARTYYVSPSGSDSNPGTSPDKPFRTLQKAADGTAPGDTVSIMNGTYKEKPGRSDVLVVSRSGKAGAPITYRAHPGHHPVINPVAAWNGIRINGASHIVVRDLEVKGNSANISLAEAERSASTKKGTYNTNCVWAEPNKATGARPHHIDIIGNTVHHCQGLGIGSRGADYMTIDRNHVYATSWYAVFATSGISILAAQDIDGGDPKKYKIRVTNNVVHDNEAKVKWEKCRCYSDGNGIIIDTLKDKAKAGEAGPDYRGRVLVANNVSYDNGGSGIHSFKSQHVDILHNTAYQNGRSTRMDSYANIFAHDSRDVRLLNNVSYGRANQATNSKSKNVDVTYDYNVYFGGRAPEVKGPHDLIADPKLVAPGNDGTPDFRLAKGSPAIGSGTPLPEITTDITGTRRNAGSADRGAYVFGAAKDAAAPEATATENGVESAAGSEEQEKQFAGKETGSVTSGADSHSDGDGNDVKAHGGGDEPAATGGGGDLAATGAGVALPLGLAAAALALGGGIFLMLRRKRT
ncbi:right-handed parallel beta-helix repeat-containing protein [Streptomyces sp. NPDC017546]|uniref:right-handed parallel beta-helix repeat-containing protein n=1 Tax=Streptomyces sp. NPDC017546 TaxID=3365001 RepID=UPI0037A1605A